MSDINKIICQTWVSCFAKKPRKPDNQLEPLKVLMMKLINWVGRWLITRWSRCWFKKQSHFNCRLRICISKDLISIEILSLKQFATEQSTSIKSKNAERIL